MDAAVRKAKKPIKCVCVWGGGCVCSTSALMGPSVEWSTSSSFDDELWFVGLMTLSLEKNSDLAMADGSQEQVHADINKYNIHKRIIV